MMKVLSKKILICILVFIIMFNFGFTIVTYADNTTNTTNTVTRTLTVKEVEESHNQQVDANSTGLIGILSMIIRLPLIILSGVVNIETYAIATSAGTIGDVSVIITPFDIIFNRFVLTDINVFSLDGLEPGGLVYEVRENISMWFGYAMGIAIGLLVVVFLALIIYIVWGNRMTTTDKNQRKADAINAFKSWVMSLLTVIVMSFIVIGLVEANNTMIGAISGVLTYDLSESMAALQAASFSTQSSILGWGATIVYSLISILTLYYLVKYIFRFFRVAILIIISPLVPVPSSISRALGQKTSNAFDAWLWEFVNAIFTQLIHAVIYTFLVSVALGSFAKVIEIKDVAALAPATFAVAAMFFVIPAEQLIRDIFKLKPAGGITTVVRTMAADTRRVANVVNNVTNGNFSNVVGGIIGGFGVDLNRQRQIPTEGTTVTPASASSIRYAESHTENDSETFTRTRSAEFNGGDLSDATMANLMMQPEMSGLAMGIGVSDDPELRGRKNELDATVASLNYQPLGLPAAGETSNTNVETIEVFDESQTASETMSSEEVASPEMKLSPEEYQRLVEKIREIVKNEIEASGITEDDLEKLKAALQSIDANQWGEEEYRNFLQENGLSDEYMNVAKALAMENATQTIKVEEPILEDDFVDVREDYDSVENDGGTAPVYQGEVIDEEAPVEVDELDHRTIAELPVDDKTKAYMMNELRSQIDTNDVVMEEAVDIATKEAIFRGEADAAIDYTAASLAELTVNTAMNGRMESADNRAAAIEKLKKIVQDAGQAELDEFNRNPSVENFEVLSDPAKELAIRQNVEAAMKLGASVNVSETVSSSKQTSRSDDTILEVTSINPVIAELAARKMRQTKGAATE